MIAHVCVQTAVTNAHSWQTPAHNCEHRVDRDSRRLNPAAKAGGIGDIRWRRLGSADSGQSRCRINSGVSFSWWPHRVPGHHRLVCNHLLYVLEAGRWLDLAGRAGLHPASPRAANYRRRAPPVEPRNAPIAACCPTTQIELRADGRRMGGEPSPHSSRRCRGARSANSSCGGSPAARRYWCNKAPNVPGPWPLVIIAPIGARLLAKPMAVPRKRPSYGVLQLARLWRVPCRRRRFGAGAGSSTSGSG